MTVRPTLRCLRDDLNLPLPTVRVPLDEIDHPILRKAAEQFAAHDTPHERIASVDDVVLFEVKTCRWRGAVLCDEPGDDALDWLVAAGIREEGATDDFYAALYTQAQAQDITPSSSPASRDANPTRGFRVRTARTRIPPRRTGMVQSSTNNPESPCTFLKAEPEALARALQGRFHCTYMYCPYRENPVAQFQPVTHEAIRATSADRCPAAAGPTTGPEALDCGRHFLWAPVAALRSNLVMASERQRT